LNCCFLQELFYIALEILKK